MQHMPACMVGSKSPHIKNAIRALFQIAPVCGFLRPSCGFLRPSCGSGFFQKARERAKLGELALKVFSLKAMLTELTLKVGGLN